MAEFEQGGKPSKASWEQRFSLIRRVVATPEYANFTALLLTAAGRYPGMQVRHHGNDEALRRPALRLMGAHELRRQTALGAFSSLQLLERLRNTVPSLGEERIAVLTRLHDEGRNETYLNLVPGDRTFSTERADAGRTLIQYAAEHEQHGIIGLDVWAPDMTVAYLPRRMAQPEIREIRSMIRNAMPLSVRFERAVAPGYDFDFSQK